MVFKTGGRGEFCCGVVMAKAVNKAAMTATEFKKRLRSFKAYAKAAANAAIDAARNISVSCGPTSGSLPSSAPLENI